MPLYKYSVSCDGCDYRTEPWAANEEEAIWGCGTDPKTAKCPKCGGRLKATTTASTSTDFSDLQRKLERSWEPADEK